MGEDPNMDGEQMMGGDPNMGGDPMMGGDTNMGGGDPMMGGDPNMGSDPMMGDDPNMEGDPNMGGDDSMDDSTTSIINQLSPEDREAVRSYAQSMLSRAEGDNGTESEGASDSQSPDAIMAMESVIFTKKQLRTIMENVGIFNNEPRKEKSLTKKSTKSVSKNSPFNSPNFRKL